MVKRQRTAVLEVKRQTVGRRDRSDGSRTSGRTVVVRRQETGVLDGDDRRRCGRAQHTQRTALQLKSTGVKHQISSDSNRSVVKGERVRTGVEVTREVCVGLIVDQLVAVQRWVVEHDWRRLEEQVQVRSPGVSTAWVPTAGQRCVGVVVWVGLVLTRCTKGTDDVVLVSCTVAVLNNNPNIGVAVGIRDVATNLEQFVHAAVKERGGDHVVGLVHLLRLSESVHRNVRQATEVNHRWVAARGRNIVGAVARVSVGVRTIVAVEVNIDENDVGSRTGLGDLG